MQKTRRNFSRTFQVLCMCKLGNLIHGNKQKFPMLLSGKALFVCFRGAKPVKLHWLLRKAYSRLVLIRRSFCAINLQNQTTFTTTFWGCKKHHVHVYVPLWEHWFHRFIWTASKGLFWHISTLVLILSLKLEGMVHSLYKKCRTKHRYQVQFFHNF